MSQNVSTIKGNNIKEYKNIKKLSYHKLDSHAGIRKRGTR